MRVKMKLLYVPMAMAVMSALVITADTSRPTTWPTTPGTSGLNLKGKMFTLSGNGGGISFYPPYYYPRPSRPWHTTTTTPRPTTTTTPRPTTTTTPRPTTTTRPWYTTTPRPTTTTTPPPTTTRPWYTTLPPTTRPWTSAPPTRGVSVCVRYLTDTSSSLFTLSPSNRNPLQLAVNSDGSYVLSFRYSYSNLYLQPNLWFWSNVGQDIWTRVCLTVDTMKNVAQVFSGSNISIRKMLPTPYVWSGEPVIDFSGFSGQVTDVQIWDYPLSYREVFYYMTNGVYGSYRGSALTWFSISYSPRGNTLLEDTYEWQARQPISSSRGRKGHRLKGRNKTRKSFSVERDHL